MQSLGDNVCIGISPQSVFPSSVIAWTLKTFEFEVTDSPTPCQVHGSILTQTPVEMRTGLSLLVSSLRSQKSNVDG